MEGMKVDTIYICPVCLSVGDNSPCVGPWETPHPVAQVIAVTAQEALERKAARTATEGGEAPDA